METNTIRAVVQERVQEVQMASAEPVRLCERVRERAAESLPCVLGAWMAGPG